LFAERYPGSACWIYGLEWRKRSAIVTGFESCQLEQSYSQDRLNGKQQSKS
jgi:hypothetical protein